MAIPKIIKGASASFSHAVDYRGWESIGDGTDTIASATASVSPSGLTLGTPAVNTDGNQVSIPLSSGTTGTSYLVTVLATTTAGEVLDAYFTVSIGTGVEGAVVYPSQFGPYIDTRRGMELLFDPGDLEDDEEVPGWETVDGNERAFFLAQSAWRDILRACTRGKVYSLQELTDLANDVVRGADLIEFCADLYWSKLIKRRRYTKGEPQGEEAGSEAVEEKLEQLRRGERIFDLTGVGDNTDNVLGTATALSTGVFGASDVCRTGNRFWGCGTGPTSPGCSSRRWGC